MGEGGGEGEGGGNSWYVPRKMGGGKEEDTVSC
jgi:hypothetical protein